MQDTKNKIISCKAKITRKKTTKFTGIKKLEVVGIKKTNRKQRARVRAFMMIEAKHVVSLPLKYAFPVPSFYHPSAIVYNDGAADWYKNGLDNGVTSL